MLLRPKYKRIGDKIILTKDYTFVFEETTYTLKKGYDSDGASIPKFMHWKYKPFDTETILGAFFHDSFYWSHKVKRELADCIFYYLMMDQDTPLAQRFNMWLAVRCFGWWYYYITPLFKGRPCKKEIDKYLKINYNKQYGRNI